MGTTWVGDNGDHGNRSHEDHMGTFWVYGDDMGMMGMTRRRCGDDQDDVGTTGTTWGGDNRDHSHGDHMGTFWGLWG